MTINKAEGIELLKLLDIPTVKKVNLDGVLIGEIPIEEGLSVRLSPKSFSNTPNVYLPSIHNCTDLSTIKDFVLQHRGRYNIFAHRTVKPDIIGSASRFDHDSIVIEMYQDFEHRKREEIANRMTIPIIGDRIMINHLSMLSEKPEDYKSFSQVITNLKKMPFNRYDVEYVIEGGQVIFTDLTIPDSRGNKEIISYLNSRQKERER